jgi:dTDP-4-amino-4,6-dideoxygalactose transaminase
MLDFPKWPSFEEDEVSAVSDVLRSGKVNYWTGDSCKKFEGLICQYFGVEYAISVANGTVALDLPLMALDISDGDEVIVTSRSFFATVSSIVRLGAIPVFADVDLKSQNISAESIEPLITENTKAIVLVHLAGWPCEMDAIIDLAQRYKLKIIEDCAQAHGAEYKGKKVGSIGDVGAFSCCQDKIISTGGEGGFITTNDFEIYKKIWSLKDHGKDYDLINCNHKFKPGFRWVHSSFSGNYRLSGIQAEIGFMQMQKLDSWIEKRTENANYLNEELKNVKGLRIELPPSHMKHAYYKYYVFLDREYLADPSIEKMEIAQEINKEGVPCFYGSCSEMYNEPAFDNTSFKPSSGLPNAINLAKDSLMFLVHPTLEKEHIEKTAHVIRSVISRFTKS